MTHPAEPIPKAISDRFVEPELYATGSTGSLYRCTDSQSGIRGILKVLRQSAQPNLSDRQRLSRDLVKQATLSHAALVLPLASGSVDGQVWLFREWVEGETLETTLKQGPLGITAALSVATDLAGALDQLHRAGLLHRDLKPGHVIMQPSTDGLPKIAILDAGIGARIESSAVFDIIGTPAYVSPEQSSGKLVSFRSDLYALGTILFEMVAGETPYGGSGDTEKILKAHASSPLPTVPDKFPASVRELVTSLLNKEPRERPFSAQQVRRSLETFVPSSDSQAPKSLDATPSRPPSPPGARPSKPPKPPEARASKPPKPPTGRPSAPPKPPVARTSAPPKPPVSNGISNGVSAAAAPVSPDQTQQLEALDIIDEVEEQAIKAAAEAEAAKASVSKPPSPPGSAAAAPGKETAALDYDDLGETVQQNEPVGLRAMAQEAAAAAIPVATADTDLDLDAPTRSMPQVDQPLVEHKSIGEMPIIENTPTTIMPERSDMETAPATGPSSVAPVQTVRSVAPSQEPTQVTSIPPQPKKSGAAVWILGLMVLFLLGVIAAGLAWFFLMKPSGTIATGPSTQTGATLTNNPGAITPAVVTPTAMATDGSGKPPAPQPTNTGTDVSVMAPDTAGTTTGSTATGSTTTGSTATGSTSGSTTSGSTMTTTPTISAMTGGTSAMTTRPSGGTSAMTTRPAGGMAAAGGMATAMGGSPFEQLRASGRELFRAGRFREAAQAYERATQINPRHAGSFVALGAARMRMGNVNGAVAAYQRAHELAPNNANYLVSLGHAFKRQGNRQSAGRAYQRALALNPQHTGARNGLNSL